MTAIVLDGAARYERIKDDLRDRVAKLAGQGVTPGLGTILVGDNPASAVYVRMKHEDCAQIGIRSFGEHLARDTTADELEAVIDLYNMDENVDAFLLQTPIPSHLDQEEALLRIDHRKDVDGLHPVNLGLLVMGAPRALPCTPAGIVDLLAAYDVPIEGAHVVVIGRGLTIGRPLALMLALKRPHANAAVTVVHTGVPNLADYTRQADILVAAAGSPGLVTADMVKPGAAVVAGGVTVTGKTKSGRNRIEGDVADDVAEVAGWLTPKVGGVGSMTRAMLLTNCVEAAERRAARGGS